MDNANFDSLIASAPKPVANPTTFNKPLGNFMKPGLYKDCKISAIECLVSKANKPYFRLEYENDQGETIRDSVSIMGVDRETGAPVWHYAFRNLAGALSSNSELNAKFFGGMLTEHKLQNRLVGLKVTVRVDAPTEGYDLRKNALEQFVMYDLSTGQPWEGLETNTFDSFDEGKDYASEHNIYRGYAKVGKLNHASGECLAENEAVIDSLVKQVESGSISPAPAIVATGTSL